MRRTCNTCNVEKEIEEFPIILGCKDGRRPKCKECVKEYHKQWNLRRNPVENRPRVIAKKLLEQGFKKCHSCEQVKPVSEYWANSRWPGGYHKNCKGCNREKFRINEVRKPGRPARADYYAEYDSREDVKQRRAQHKRASSAKSPRNVMQITLRHGLKRRPTVSPATIDDLMAMFHAQKGRCAVTGIIMTWAQGTVLPTSISLDRIDHTQGYSADNLRLVCHAINAFRGRMSDAEMLAMAKAIVANLNKSAEATWDSFPAFTDESAHMALQ